MREKDWLKTLEELNMKQNISKFFKVLNKLLNNNKTQTKKYLYITESQIIHKLIINDKNG